MVKKLKNFWREPLIHFILIGVSLFLLFNFTKEQDKDAPNRIVVTAGQVDQVTAQFSRTWMRPPTEAEIKGLIDSIVRDEVYYREALAMGLNENDPLIRRRMRMKLEFILEDLSAQNDPDDQILEMFLQQNADKFMVESRASFRQVYLNPDKRWDLEKDAAKILGDLRNGSVSETLGDPTLLPEAFYSVAYSEIARTFGNAFAKEIASLEPDKWTGPVYSGLGAHLVLVTESRKGHLPKLAEIRTRVENEYMAQRRQKMKDAAYRKLLEGYEVVVEAVIPENDKGKAMAATIPNEAGP